MLKADSSKSGQAEYIDIDPIQFQLFNFQRVHASTFVGFRLVCIEASEYAQHFSMWASHVAESRTKKEHENASNSQHTQTHTIAKSDERKGK